MRILIIAHAFPPLNSVGAHRSYGWARTWSDLGHDVHVLTPAKGALDGSMDLERDLTGIEVHEVPYLLAGARGRAAVHGSRQSHAEHWEHLKTLSRRLRFGMAMFGDPRLLAYRAMLQSGLELAREQTPHLIVASSPPEIDFLVARALSRRTGIPWVADFRDLWFRDMRLYHTRIAAWLAGPVNRWMVKSALALVTVSRGLQDRLAGYLGREVLVSYNGFFESDRGASAHAAARGDGRLHIVYTGRVYPGKQDPEPLFRTLNRLARRSPELAGRLCVDIYGYDNPWLRSLVEKHRVRAYVAIHGFVPHRESIALQRAADVLLLFDWTDVRAKGVLTGKLFEYFGSGRPILSIGCRSHTEVAALIAETRCGVTLTTDEEVSTYLLQLLSAGRPPDVGRETVSRFSREKQADELLRSLQEQFGKVAALQQDAVRGLR